MKEYIVRVNDREKVVTPFRWRALKKLRYYQKQFRAGVCGSPTFVIRER